MSFGPQPALSAHARENPITRAFVREPPLPGKARNPPVPRAPRARSRGGYARNKVLEPGPPCSAAELLGCSACGEKAAWDPEAARRAGGHARKHCLDREFKENGSSLVSLAGGTKTPEPLELLPDHARVNALEREREIQGQSLPIALSGPGGAEGREAGSRPKDGGEGHPRGKNHAREHTLARELRENGANPDRPSCLEQDRHRVNVLGRELKENAPPWGEANPPKTHVVEDHRRRSAMKAEYD